MQSVAEQWWPARSFFSNFDAFFLKPISTHVRKKKKKRKSLKLQSETNYDRLLTPPSITGEAGKRGDITTWGWECGSGRMLDPKARFNTNTSSSPPHGKGLFSQYQLSLQTLLWRSGSMVGVPSQSRSSTTMCMLKIPHDGRHTVVWATKTLHKLVGIGRATLAAAVALPRQGNQNFPQEINYVLKREKKNRPGPVYTQIQIRVHFFFLYIYFTNVTVFPGAALGESQPTLWHIKSVLRTNTDTLQQKYKPCFEPPVKSSLCLNSQGPTHVAYKIGSEDKHWYFAAEIQALLWTACRHCVWIAKGRRM